MQRSKYQTTLNSNIHNAGQSQLPNKSNSALTLGQPQRKRKLTNIFSSNFLPPEFHNLCLQVPLVRTNYTQHKLHPAQTTPSTNHTQHKLHTQTTPSTNYTHKLHTHTHYCAESLSWYSLDLRKQSCTPWSSHSLLMAASSPGVNGSVSACLAVMPNNSMASSCVKTERER